MMFIRGTHTDSELNEIGKKIAEEYPATGIVAVWDRITPGLTAMNHHKASAMGKQILIVSANTWEDLSRMVSEYEAEGWRRAVTSPHDGHGYGYSQRMVK